MILKEDKRFMRKEYVYALFVLKFVFFCRIRFKKAPYPPLLRESGHKLSDKNYLIILIFIKNFKE